MGFAELSNLQSHLNTLQEKLGSYKNQLEKLKRRKKSVEGIIRDMQSVCNNKCIEVNEFINNVVYSLDYAIKGVTNPSKNNALGSKEKSIDYDGNMSSSYSYIKSELNDINKRIDETQTKIKSANSQIDDCKWQIRSQKSSIANSYRTAYYNANNKCLAAERAYRANPTDVLLKQEYNKAIKNKNQAKIEYDKYSSWL